MTKYFIALICLTGIVSTYTDVRERKIKNKHLLIICCCACLLYGFGLLSKNMTLSLPLFLNPIAGLIIGFVFYLCGIWNPGDAKLFFTYSLLLPTNVYYFVLPLSCLVLLLNVFLISFFIIPLLYMGGIINNKNALFKKVISKQTLFYFARIVLITLCLSWIVLPIVHVLGIKKNIFLNFVIIFCGYWAMYRFINKVGNIFVVIAILATGLALRLFYTPSFFNVPNVIAFLLSTLIYSGIFYVLTLLIDLKETNPSRIPFSPFMFAAALLTNTGFLWLILRFNR